MSRSFKKTPVFGNTTARSEKADKVIAHGKERAHVRTTLKGSDDLEAVQLSTKAHAHSNVWDFAKDGKHFVPNLRVRLVGRALVGLSTPRWVKGSRQLHKALAK